MNYNFSLREIDGKFFYQEENRSNIFENAKDAERFFNDIYPRILKPSIRAFLLLAKVFKYKDGIFYFSYKDVENIEDDSKFKIFKPSFMEHDFKSVCNLNYNYDVPMNSGYSNENFREAVTKYDDLYFKKDKILIR